MFSLIELLGRAAPRIDIVDVGAMWLVSDLPYKALLRDGVGHVIGFEPVQAECDKLNNMKMKNHTSLPYFIGDGKDATFHLCSSPMTSSLYEPNIKLLRKFNELEELTTCVEKYAVKTKRLDDIPEITK